MEFGSTIQGFTITGSITNFIRRFGRGQAGIMAIGLGVSLTMYISVGIIVIIVVGIVTDTEAIVNGIVANVMGIGVEEDKQKILS